MSNQYQVIPIEVKKKCCDLFSKGNTVKSIYDDYFSKQFEKPQTYLTFRGSIKHWIRSVYPDDLTLQNGTYEGFTAHGATVQVSATGEIVQAWIKQHVNEFIPEDFIAAIKDEIEPYNFKPIEHDDSRDMLEIPLFDMHWGIAFMDHYESVLDKIIEIIRSHHWKKIVIPFGQDFFHNDSIINAQTTKGTYIEKVDMIRAVKEGKKFMYSLIDCAIEYSDEVKVLYSTGNHDRSISWMFIQVLAERYGTDIVDDSLKFRKIVTYGKNSIMITHGDSKRSTSANLAHIFPISFPEEFANANVREVHSGHLHCESDSDVFGVMVRRLSSGNITDNWSDREDYVGTHKRFMLFEWNLEKLKAIHYI